MSRLAQCKRGHHNKIRNKNCAIHDSPSREWRQRMDDALCLEMRSGLELQPCTELNRAWV